jgi:hypothetical protein
MTRLFAVQDQIPMFMLKHLPLWFPGAGFKRQAIGWRKAVYEMVDVPFDAVKRALVCSQVP